MKKVGIVFERFNSSLCILQSETKLEQDFLIYKRKRRNLHYLSL